MWEFGLTTPAASGLGELRIQLLLDGATLLERRVAIATDPWVAEHGVQARGGCGVGRAESSHAAAIALAVAVGIARRRRSRA
jgi:MYXO-CTERM domain-containing protein